ncbi:M23 family metallopeptidase [Zhihengliuella salsuginis]|uniref:M23ase beta-sheet core domain-containing protein n=1 Tax=Zhihengliuella salsuginis TaxID=578222 RepID=A0ABQ3GCQ8_9MICC|nr:M23 family metallopeptidase [Zhihengliuella salsuginis]GHD00535.1 hypothetical protein GCM10008096_03970 [Zhihengliuella salsuginis]
MPSRPLPLLVPLAGRFRVENSPADRVPSHGTHAFGSGYAIDFVPVDASGRSALPGLRRRWGSEPPEDFVGFGAPVLAPVSGRVVEVHDGAADHPAHRSPLARLAYAAGQAGRARDGASGLAGNRVVIAVGDAGPFVLIAHLRCGSAVVAVGDRVRAGQQVGACGNTGNSTEPHVHVQASDSTDWERAAGVPIAFRLPGGVRVPGTGEIVP